MGVSRTEHNMGTEQVLDGDGAMGIEGGVTHTRSLDSPSLLPLDYALPSHPVGFQCSALVCVSISISISIIHFQFSKFHSNINCFFFCRNSIAYVCVFTFPIRRSAIRSRKQWATAAAHNAERPDIGLQAPSSGGYRSADHGGELYTQKYISTQNIWYLVL